MTTAPTLLDAICEELGVGSLSEREAWRVGSESITAHRILEAQSRWAEAAVIPDLRSDELRPLRLAAREPDRTPWRPREHSLTAAYAWM